MNRLDGDLIRVGRPIPVDCFDSQGRLILKRGSIIDSQRQLEFLLGHGLFGGDEVCPPSNERARDDHPSTPFRQLHDCRQRLARIIEDSAAVANRIDTEESAAAAALASTRQLEDFLQGKPSGASDALPESISPFPGLVLQLAGDIQDLCQTDPDAALGAIHLDDIGAHHAIGRALNRAVVTELLAARRGIPPRNRRTLTAAALTCDLSMLPLQDELARQAKPFAAQRQAITAHPQETVKRLAALGVIDPSWTNVVIQHHEFPDGTGYPASLAGDLISLWARIVRLADVYTALIGARTYRKPLLAKEVVRRLFSRRDSELDAELAAMLIKELGLFPPGIWVKLHNGETAIVIRRETNPRAPLVKAVIGPTGTPLALPIPRQTTTRDHEIVDVVEPDRRLNIDRNKLWGYAG